MSPQGELLDRADRYARLLILGQTMSGSQDASKGGGKAFGEVEGDVKKKRIEAAGRYACRVLNTQIIPSILTLNYGDADEAPKIVLIADSPAGSGQAATFKTLADAGVRIGQAYVRKLFEIPEPAEDEETIGGESEEEAEPMGMSFADDDDEELSALAAAAGRKKGDPFRGNQYTGGIHVTLPDEHWKGDREVMRIRARETMKGFTPVQHPKLGEVTFSADGRGETLSRQQNAHEFQSVQALPALIPKCKVVGFSADNRGRPDVRGYHELEGGLKIGKTSYRVQVLIKESTDGTRTLHQFCLHCLRHKHGPVKASATGPTLDATFRRNPGPGGESTFAEDANAVKALAQIAAIEDDAGFASALRDFIATHP